MVVPVRYEALVEPPLLRHLLKDPSEPLLAAQLVFTRAQGTNFPLPEAAAARLEALVGTRLTPVTSPTAWTPTPADGGPVFVRAVDEAGLELDADFSVEPEGSSTAIFLESRGGRRGAARTRNPDYEDLLGLILRRLSARGSRLLDATVESRIATRLPHLQKVLNPGAPFPLDLASSDTEAVRRYLQASQVPIAQAPGAKGGNSTKRTRLLVDTPPAAATELIPDLVRGVVGSIIVDERLTRTGTSRRGQGRSVDAKANAAIERRAMAVVRRRLEAAGWRVEDKSQGNPFDLACAKDGREMHVEVKGLQGSKPEVSITEGERRHVAEEWADCVLAVVCEIKLNRPVEADPVASGGRVLWYEPWRIDDGVLTPTNYRWRPGGGG